MRNFLMIFGALAVMMAIQLWFTAIQAQAFMRTVRDLRGKGRVAIGLGGTRWIGRRVYLAITVDPEDRVITAARLRGVTQFARARAFTGLEGLTISQLADDTDLPGVDKLTREAARQAAKTLDVSGRLHPTGDATTGKEQAQPATSHAQ